MSTHQHGWCRWNVLAVALMSFAIPAAAFGAAAALRVSGNHFVDGQGRTVRLRGVNVSGLELVAVQGWSPANPWGGMTGDPSPNWNVMKSWKINAVRIPLNEASWLDYRCADASGKLRDPDPGHNYRATVKRTVDGATAAGLYVILDLHWTAPKNFCPLAQNPMADLDNAVGFWTQIATQFRNQANVAFELFNEPYSFWLAPGEKDWHVLRDGGEFTSYASGDGKRYQVPYTWKSAGMQQMLDAVRATGATNVVLIGAPSWCQDLSRWVEFKPNDPKGQIAAVWHAYPNSGTVGDPKAAEPKFGMIAYRWAQSVLDAGYPVIITEFGDHNAPGTRGAPFVSQLLPWADKAGASYLGWTWDVWKEHDNVLIKDKSGTPSDGYGVYVRDHYLCVARERRIVHSWPDRGSRCRAGTLKRGRSAAEGDFRTWCVHCQELVRERSKAR